MMHGKDDTFWVGNEPVIHLHQLIGLLTCVMKIISLVSSNTVLSSISLLLWVATGEVAETLLAYS